MKKLKSRLKEAVSYRTVLKSKAAINETKITLLKSLIIEKMKKAASCKESV